MKIRLVANGSRRWERWIRRWGLSVLVNDNVLFDTFGAPSVLIKNFRRFGVSWDRLNTVVVSHEHWDHIGGLETLLRRKPGLSIYVPEHADQALKEGIVSWGGRCEVGARRQCLGEGIYTSGEVIGLYAGKQMPEQGLVLETSSGLVAILGCAHPGLMTMLEHIRAVFGRPVYGVIGGFHLQDETSANLFDWAHQLKASGVSVVAPLHCSGEQASRIFKKVFDSGYLALREGQEITF